MAAAVAGGQEPLLAGCAGKGAPSPDASRSLTRWLGYASLAAMVLSWVFQSEVAQYIQSTLGYDKPWAVTWLNHGTMGLLLPLLWLWQPTLWRDVAAESGMPLRRVLGACALLSVLYTAGDYVWYVALPMTTVGEATALFNSQSVFTFCFSVLLLREAVLPSKLLSVALSVAGVATIAASGGGSAGAGRAASGRRVLGDLLVLGAGASYSAYEVGFKWALSSVESLAVVNAVTGLVGLCSLLVAAPGFPLLDAAAVEPFAWPGREVAGWLALNAALALGFNVGLLLCVACLSPLTASVGCLLTIPLSDVVDYLWHGTAPALGDIGGALLITSGFALLVRADLLAERGAPCCASEQPCRKQAIERGMAP